MAISKVKVEEFLHLAQSYPVLDVRSPSEYTQAHIPGAYSLPLFSDDERKVVGTIYKQQSREDAVKTGLDYFGPKMRRMVEEVEALCIQRKAKNNCVLVHCWRGGMRSAGVAWLLDLYGFKVYTLIGGYKAFRHWVLERFEQQYPLRVLGGYTGSGKTHVLGELRLAGEVTVDLEEIAVHKGSAFGDIEGKAQPRQEMFENLLAVELDRAVSKLNGGHSSIWVEDESQRIGHVNLPGSFWKQMREAPLFFLEIAFDERLDYIVEEYGKIPKDKLAAAIMRIQKRLGGLDTKMAVNYLLENNIKACFSILLKYYDKHYFKALHARPQLESVLQAISCEGVNARANMQKIKALNTIAG